MSSILHKRLGKELRLISSYRKIKEVEIEEDDMKIWYGLLHPENPPYNEGAFKIRVVFPEVYPFHPPKVRFLTKIYHPNIDEEGNVSVNFLPREEWLAGAVVGRVLDLLLELLDNPQLEYPLRPELEELYIKDKKAFMKNAYVFTRMYSELRAN